MALDFLAAVKQRRATAGPRRGELIGGPTVHNILTDVEQFYAWMADHKLEAARALRRSALGAAGRPAHPPVAAGEKPRISARPRRRRRYFDETTMAQLMRHAGLLAAPKDEGGLGDEQAMRILMLLARTGRRVSELLLLDFDPILPITGLAAEADENDPDAVVAKLRFQQTKIDGAPNTIFVDQEVVAIVRAQQSGRTRTSARCLRDQNAPPPRYLFLAITRNNRGRHPYPKTTLGGRMNQLGELADIRDSQRRRPPLSNVHRFRHTRATSLINANVPVHVVQRYLGHLSPKDDDALLQDAPRDARARVPAAQEDHRRRQRSRPRPARPVRADRAGQAHRPGAAQRAVHAPAAPGVQPRQRMPDLRQVHHRRQLPARARTATGQAQRADRAATGRLPGANR